MNTRSCNGQKAPAPDKRRGPCVYILQCRDGTLYTGWTSDFQKRLAVHNRGKGAKYTRGRLPVTPVYLEYLPDKVTATRREAAIKKLTRAKKQQLIASERNCLAGVSSRDPAFDPLRCQDQMAPLANPPVRS